VIIERIILASSHHQQHPIAIVGGVEDHFKGTHVALKRPLLQLLFPL